MNVAMCRVVLWFCGCIIVSSVVSAAPAVHLTAGFALGGGESIFAENILQQAATQVEGLEVSYDRKTTDSFDDAGHRFDKEEVLSDLVFLYVGMREQISEVSQLADRGALQAIDLLPDYASLPLNDFHSNLMEPVKYKGQLWAIPIRVCPPVLFLDSSASESLGSWKDVVECSRRYGFTHTRERDYYMLWMSLLSSRGSSVVGDGLYQRYSPAFGDGFENIASLYQNDRFRDWENPRFGMLVPDEVFKYAYLREKVKFYPFPESTGSSVYCGESTWYLGVSSLVAGAKRKVLVDFLGAMVSEKMQLYISENSFSPPSRVSIDTGAAFKRIFPVGTPQRVFSEMTGRLKFRRPGRISEECERIIEGAFGAALSSPTKFQELYEAAVTEANELSKADPESGRK